MLLHGCAEAQQVSAAPIKNVSTSYVIRKLQHEWKKWISSCILSLNESLDLCSHAIHFFEGFNTSDLFLIHFNLI